MSIQELLKPCLPAILEVWQLEFELHPGSYKHLGLCSRFRRSTNRAEAEVVEGKHSDIKRSCMGQRGPDADTAPLLMA